MIKNLIHLLSSPRRLLSYIIMVILLLLLWWNSTDIQIMFGNYGKIQTYTDIVLSGILITMFPLFITAIFYKSLKYGKRTNINGKSFTGVAGGIIGTIISGASCCGATLAASFGLLPIMTLLPYSGLEIKIVGTVGVLYALREILIQLETCKIKI